MGRTFPGLSPDSSLSWRYGRPLLPIARRKLDSKSQSACARPAPAQTSRGTWRCLAPGTAVYFRTSGKVLGKERLCHDWIAKDRRRRDPCGHSCHCRSVFRRSAVISVVWSRREGVQAHADAGTGRKLRRQGQRSPWQRRRFVNLHGEHRGTCGQATERTAGSYRSAHLDCPGTRRSAHDAGRS